MSVTIKNTNVNSNLTLKVHQDSGDNKQLPKIIMNGFADEITDPITDLVITPTVVDKDTRVLDVNSSVRVAAGKQLAIKTSGDDRTITGEMEKKGEESTAPAGFGFSADASFIIPNPEHTGEEGDPTPATVDVRISELYNAIDPEADVKTIANVLSAVCRRVFDLEHLGVVPEGVGKAHQGGEKPNSASDKLDGDAAWITYYACKNLDSGVVPDK